MGGVMPHRPCGRPRLSARQHDALIRKEDEADAARRAKEKLLPGAWRRFVQEQIILTRQEINDQVRRWFELCDVLAHVRRHSAQNGTVRDMMRERMATQVHAEVQLRKLRGLLLLTKICPRCRGRGQKFNRRRMNRGPVMKPCSLCRAQGALWVTP